MNTKRSFEEKYNYLKSSMGLHINPNGEFEINYNLPPEWVQTFITGEGLFYIYFSEEEKIIHPSLEIGQNNHDIAILLDIKKFFNGGYIKPKYNFNEILECKNSRSVNRYILRNVDTIINFVEKYPMLTEKQLDFED